jgi:hypothetical protein
MIPVGVVILGGVIVLAFCLLRDEQGKQGKQTKPEPQRVHGVLLPNLPRRRASLRVATVDRRCRIAWWSVAAAPGVTH